MPTGCQTVLVSRNAIIRRTSGGPAQSAAGAAGGTNTRLRFPAASRSSSARSAGATPDKSIAFTSIWAARTGASSAVRPVSTFTTPGGTSAVAITSVSVTAGNGRGSLATTTAVLPVTMTGASTLTSPSRLEPAGAITATTPVGSGRLKLKYGPATGFAAPATCATLSAQPANHTHRSTASATRRPACTADPPSAAATSAANCAARPSSISATR